MTKLNQAFGDQGKIDQGSNGSERLAIDKNGHISIGLPKVNKFLKFKAFVTDFSRTAESSYEEEAFAVSDSPRYIKGAIKNQIKLTFDVPAQSMNEARINLQRVQELCRFFLSSREDLKKFTHNPEYYTVYVQFSNFIHKYGGLKGMSDTYEEVVKHGEKCIFTGFSFEIDVESGFFEGDENIDSEDKGKLIPKKMSITMELTPIVEDVKKKDPSAIQFFEKFSKAETALSDVDVQYPFGIDYE